MRRLFYLCILLLSAACSDFRVAPGQVDPEPISVGSFDGGVERSEASFAIEVFYQDVERSLLARGLLREDGGGPDVPFTDGMLARNFLALAFSEEFSTASGTLIRQTTPSTLHRWKGPVRIETHIGDSVAADRAVRDREAIVEIVQRLAATTSHPVRSVRQRGNFHVVILNDQNLRTSGPKLAELMPELTPAAIDFAENLPRENYCVVFASDSKDDGEYTRALAVIRAELPDKLRMACIHEEIAQGLGLADDSPLARPSIFNDDDEFGRLTTMDELLLGMLYHSSLHPGMNRSTAEPIARRIAADLMSPGS